MAFGCGKLLLIGLLALPLLLMGCTEKPGVPTPTPTAVPTASPVAGAQSQDALGHFKSWEDAKEFVSLVSSGSYYGRYAYGMPLMMNAVAGVAVKASDATGVAPAPEASGRDYSQTNVQVQGVDEPDIVKSDGTYLYVVGSSQGNSDYRPMGKMGRYPYYGGEQIGKVSIVKAFPASEMRVVSTIQFNGSVENVFVNGDKLVVFGYERVLNEEKPPLPTDASGVAKKMVASDAYYPYYPAYSQKAFARVFDVSDKGNPKQIKEFSLEDGSYYDARMIGNKVYAIFNKQAYADKVVPLYAVNGLVKTPLPQEVSFIDYPDSWYQYAFFETIDLSNLNSLDSESSTKIVLMGGSQNLFVSENNAYLSYTKYDYQPTWKFYEELLNPMPRELESKVWEIDNSPEYAGYSGWRKDLAKRNALENYLGNLTESEQTDFFNKVSEKQNSEQFVQAVQGIAMPGYQGSGGNEFTVIHKFSLGTPVKYEATGEVKGHVLNQFSMDESKGFFRIAVTTGEVWGENPTSKNHVFVLDDGMNVVGKLEDLAPGEKIYSARFLGNRAYLVTFKKVDPLFVIDLSDATNPRVLGKLKIPGYSDYLHPFDETHIIGIGKEAVESETGNFAWYQGIKIALFDVSDPTNPKEVSKYNIGDRGTDSYALQDHKAFLFNKEKQLLVVPILLAQIEKSKYANGEVPGNAYGDYTFQGAFVFNLNLENGFQLRGKISHANPEDLAKSGYYYGGESVKRSAYIENSLYTVSDKLVKASDLGTLQKVSEAKLG